MTLDSFSEEIFYQQIREMEMNLFTFEDVSIYTYVVLKKRVRKMERTESRQINKI